MAQTPAERARREQRVDEISQEQARIRENMGKLAPNSELYNRYVKKLDQQETELEEPPQGDRSSRTPRPGSSAS